MGERVYNIVRITYDEYRNLYSSSSRHYQRSQTLWSLCLLKCREWSAAQSPLAPEASQIYFRTGWRICGKSLIAPLVKLSLHPPIKAKHDAEQAASTVFQVFKRPERVSNPIRVLNPLYHLLVGSQCNLELCLKEIKIAYLLRHNSIMPDISIYILSLFTK